MAAYKVFLVSCGWSCKHTNQVRQTLAELEPSYRWADLRQSLPRDPQSDRTLDIVDSVMVHGPDLMEPHGATDGIPRCPRLPLRVGHHLVGRCCHLVELLHTLIGSSRIFVRVALPGFASA